MNIKKYVLNILSLVGKHFFYIALVVALILIVSGTLLLYYSYHEESFLVKKWMYVSFHGDQPVDVSIIGNYVYAIGVNVRTVDENTSSAIVVYKFDLYSGELLWRIMWKPRDNAFVYPLGVYCVGENLVIPFLYNNRHMVGILYYDLDGILKHVRYYNFSSILWVYDVEPFHDGSIYIAGTRYKIGRKLEFYIAKIAPSNTIEWEFINGTSEDDMITSIKISRDGIVYAWGTSQNKNIILSLDTTGAIQWIKNLDTNTIKDVYVGKVNLYLLIEDQQDNKYKIITLDKFTGKITSIETIIDNIGKKLNTLSLLNTRTIYAGSIKEENEHNALILVSKDKIPNNIENTIIVNVIKNDEIQKITIQQDNIIVLGSTDNRLFIYCFNPKH